MTNEQIQNRAIELFNQYGPLKNRMALSELYNEVMDSGREFHKYVNGRMVYGDLHNNVDQLAWEVYPIPDFLLEGVNALKSLIGKTATILKADSMGFCQNFVATIEKVSVQNYAQYNNLIKIQYRPKRKRTSYAIYVDPLMQIAVYAGEVKANTETMSKVISKNNDVVVTELGSAFDSRHFTGAIKSVNQKPIFIKNERQY